MDRDTIVKQCKDIKIFHKLPADWPKLVEYYVNKKEHPELLQKTIEVFSIPGLGNQLLWFMLEELEREFKVNLIIFKNKIIDIY